MLKDNSIEPNNDNKHSKLSKFKSSKVFKIISFVLKTILIVIVSVILIFSIFYRPNTSSASADFDISIDYPSVPSGDFFLTISPFSTPRSISSSVYNNIFNTTTSFSSSNSAILVYTAGTVFSNYSVGYVYCSSRPSAVGSDGDYRVVVSRSSSTLDFYFDVTLSTVDNFHYITLNSVSRPSSTLDVLYFGGVKTSDGLLIVNTISSFLWSCSYSSLVEYGYDIGNEDGFSSGYNAGYSVGYDDGLSASSGIVNPITFMLSPISVFLNTPLFGDFSIGSALSIALFVSLALIFLKMFAGG